MNEVCSGRKILVVEDEAPLADVLKFRLEASGFSVTMAVDGQEALQKAREEAPDMILLDLMLPKIDGYKVCRLLKFDEKYKHIPIIVLSARKQECDVELASEMGADSFVSKPYHFNDLLEKMNSLLGAKSPESCGDPAS